MISDGISYGPNYPYDIALKRGATSPNLRVQLLDDADNPIDLNDASVEFYMEDVGTDSFLISAPASIIDADSGEVSYKWSDGDTDKLGTHNAFFAVDYDGGTGADFNADQYFPSDEFLNVEINEEL